ncbi:MAG: hypothetical protein GX038_06940 [Erysipelothrix sp.]|nr:hypothetical protein [Erysipelothrix sp.]
MKINYSEQVLEDLSSLNPIQVHILLDYFENKHYQSDTLIKGAKVFKSGIWRILFIEESDTITVLRIIQ